MRLKRPFVIVVFSFCSVEQLEDFRCRRGRAPPLFPAEVLSYPSAGAHYPSAKGASPDPPNHAVLWGASHLLYFLTHTTPQVMGLQSFAWPWNRIRKKDNGWLPCGQRLLYFYGITESKCTTQRLSFYVARNSPLNVKGILARAM